jgi:hypothetical protein
MTVMKEDIDRAYECGCIEYVTKPLVEDPFSFVERMAALGDPARQ